MTLELRSIKNFKDIRTEIYKYVLDNIYNFRIVYRFIDDIFLADSIFHVVFKLNYSYYSV